MKLSSFNELGFDKKSLPVKGEGAREGSIQKTSRFIFATAVLLSRWERSKIG